MEHHLILDQIHHFHLVIMLLVVPLLILPGVNLEDLVFLFHLGIMLLAVLFLILLRVYPEGLVFLHHLEDLIFLDQVAPIFLEAQVILLLLVFNFLLEDTHLGVHPKLGVNLKLGQNPKLQDIIQFTGNLCLDCKPKLGIFISKEINNILGGKLLK